MLVAPLGHTSAFDTRCGGLPTIGSHRIFTHRIASYPVHRSDTVVLLQRVYGDRGSVRSLHGSLSRHCGICNVFEECLSLALFKPSPLPTHFEAAIGTASARPASGGTVTGHYMLDAIAALGNTPVTRVEFRLSGHGLHDALVCGGTPSLFGWLCDWNTSLVSNGTYSMQSVAYDPTGRSIRSKPISVSVKNLR